MEHRSPRWIEWKVRELHPKVQAEPNAPLLHRIAQHPYALRTGRGTRQTIATPLEPRPRHTRALGRLERPPVIKEILSLLDAPRYSPMEAMGAHRRRRTRATTPVPPKTRP